MDMQGVPSANLDLVGYDEMSQTMDIVFGYHAELYRFFSISKDLFETMMGTLNSPGKFFYHNIRLVYPYVRLR